MCKVIEDFKMNLIEDGKSAKTIESYIGDIDFLNYSIKIYGKGGKFREVPLKFDLADTIKEYIKDRDYNVKISSKRYRKVL